MTTPIDAHSLARSPSTGRNLPQDDRPSPSPIDEKYTRLEVLLRQTLSLAGEIAEHTSSQRPSHISATGTGRTHIAGECIILGKTSRLASEIALRLRRQSSSGHARHKLRPSNDSEQDSTSPSAASSIQEPFSPGSLAMSLDAIVEGERSDIPLVEIPNLSTDRLLDSPPLTGVTPSQAPTSPRCPAPGSTLGQDSSSQSVASPPIPIPGQPRHRPSTSHRTSSPRLSGEDDPSPTPPSPVPRWHVRIVPLSLDSEPILSSSPPRAPAIPAFVKLEAVFPYHFFSDRHAAARWSGEGSNVIIGRSPVNEEYQSLLDLDKCEYEFGPAMERSLQDLIEDWEVAVDEQEESEERKGSPAV